MRRMIPRPRRYRDVRVSRPRRDRDETFKTTFRDVRSRRSSSDYTISTIHCVPKKHPLRLFIISLL